MYRQKCLNGDEPRIFVTDDFIQTNQLSININAARDIVKNDDDFFGFRKEVALWFLPLEEAEEFLRPEYVTACKEGKEEYRQMTSVEEAAQDFLDYMVFAWSKADNERGISASRSIEKLTVWMKILNRPDVANVLDDNSLYNPYGKPALKKACDMLGIKYPKYL